MLISDCALHVCRSEASASLYVRSAVCLLVNVVSGLETLLLPSSQSRVRLRAEVLDEAVAHEDDWGPRLGLSDERSSVVISSPGTCDQTPFEPQVKRREHSFTVSQYIYESLTALERKMAVLWRKKRPTLATSSNTLSVTRYLMLGHRSVLCRSSACNASSTDLYALSQCRLP